MKSITKLLLALYGLGRKLFIGAVLVGAAGLSAIGIRTCAYVLKEPAKNIKNAVTSSLESDKTPQADDKTPEKPKPNKNLVFDNSPTVATGTFSVQVLTENKQDKQFVISLLSETSDKKGINIHIEEKGKDRITLAADSTFSVVFWDPAKPKADGFCFQIKITKDGKCFVGQHQRTNDLVYVSNGESFAIKPGSNKAQPVAGNYKANLSGAKTLGSFNVTAPRQRVQIIKNIHERHLTEKKPLIFTSDRGR